MNKSIHNSLRQWFAKHGRDDLPWRNTDDVYHVYLSEVMLQQTQVKRVCTEYYPKFLSHFPTLRDLAKSDLETIYSLWSGLGYYSRAANLHQTALITNGVLPRQEKELQKLPGIGRYTASAICCFGYNQAVPVVDTNIKRVIRRLYALNDPKEKEIWEYAKRLLDIQQPKQHNLALMDIGATLCLPKETKCEICPLQKWCKGRHDPFSFTTVKKQNSVFMELFYGIYEENGKIAFLKSEGPMYKGLLVLPTCDPIEEDLLGSFKHAYTKYRLKVNIYSLEELPKEQCIFLPYNEALHANISSLTKKALILWTKQHQAMQ